MEYTTLLAGIFGPLLTILGVWILTKYEDAKKMWGSTENSPSALFLGAFLNLLVGLTILNLYHAWTFGIPVLLTIIGYVMLIRALLVLFSQQTLIKVTDKVIGRGRFIGLVPLSIGLLLSYHAFMQ